MKTKLAIENKYGAYMGVRKEFLTKFRQIDDNPNFDVFESKDGSKRLVVAKCSRLPDDEDRGKGKFGMDFHRAKPTISQAKTFHEELPNALQSRYWLGNIAFAAQTKDAYEQKSKAYDDFYSYIFGSSAKTVYVTPHSGDVMRKPDNLLPYPKLEIDAWTAGVAALCVFEDKRKPSKRTMISIHANGYLGAVIDLGGFGILDRRKLELVADRLGNKYRERINQLASEYKRNFGNRARRRLKHIQTARGTLVPSKLQLISTSDKYDVVNIEKGLKLYKQRFEEYTVEEFDFLLTKVDENKILPVSANYIFSGEKVGRLLRLKERIRHGLLSSPIQVECSKLYLKKEPELISEIILDARNELFS